MKKPAGVIIGGLFISGQFGRLWELAC